MNKFITLLYKDLGGIVAVALGSFCYIRVDGRLGKVKLHALALELRDRQAKNRKDKDYFVGYTVTSRDYNSRWTTLDKRRF